jgi:nucleotide-binding universal stress UspA family protein
LASAVKSILVPIDCSAATPGVLTVARELATAMAAEIHLVHVRGIPAMLPVTPLGYGAVGMPEMAPMAGMMAPEQMMAAGPPNEEECRKLKVWQTEISGAGLSVSLHEPTGTVLDEILARAGEVKADLIVMGRHGHGAMYNLLVGSVTEGVLKQSNCPVVLVPSGKL